MEVEHDIKVLKVDANLQAEIERLTKEGWTLVPGVQPVAIYHVVRQKHAPLQSGLGHGTLTIDDSKVHIMRNGQIVG